ncbi:hypothetical protein R1flu_005240 [Riccia fluitans]|uniref:Uncharacterized protein n=1 Tax=Riccia fluitans TaxID=41844 RepID=A0ABD1YSL9_9MARC
MDHLRRADAKVAHAAHPTAHARWRLNRYNPRLRWRLKKQKMRHPIEHQKRKARARFNYMNPFFYLKRIKNNLKGIFRRRTH